MHPRQILVARDRCAWPNLFHLDSARVGAVIFDKPSHGLEEGNLELWIYERSADTWQYLSTPCPKQEGQNRMHCSCGVDRNGCIHILSSGFAIANHTFIKLESLWHSLSTDGGKTWQISKDLVVSNISSPLIPHGSLLCNDQGWLQASVYSSFGKDNPSYTWLIQSKDHGASWHMQSRIGDGDTNEAHLAVCKNMLLAAVRTHRDHHTRLFSSSDKGTGWQDCGPLTLPMQHPGHLLTFREGCLLLTFGIRNKGLMAIGGRFSLDEGRTWLAPFVLCRFPDSATDCGYPSSVMLDQDRVLTGYYTNDSDQYCGYQFGTLHWSISDYLSLKSLHSISDGRQMQI